MSTQSAPPVALSEWLTEVFDEEERPSPTGRRHGNEVLARIAADRQILALHTGTHECPSADDSCGWWTPGEQGFEGEQDVTCPECPTARLLASVYSDRPGYRDEWRPDAP